MSMNYTGGSVPPTTAGALPTVMGATGGTATVGVARHWQIGPDGSPYGSPDHHYHQEMQVCSARPSFEQCHVAHGLADGLVLPVAVVSTLSYRLVRDTLPHK
jgi:hypothetical protein